MRKPTRKTRGLSRWFSRRTVALQVALGHLHHLVECRRVVDRDLGERLAIQSDVRLLQAVDELAVAHAAHSAGGVDAHDPQLAELALADPAIAEGVDAGADQGHQRLPVQVVPAGAEAFGEFAGAFAATLERYAATGSDHDLLLSRGGQGHVTLDRRVVALAAASRG